jgi:glycerol-3-phosphate dehydrogenase
MDFSARDRDRNLRELAAETVDVLIVGGGITGAGVARDAALRGLRVGLVEARDFAAGTSSRSSKLIHGGLRYLQQGDVGLVREAATERYAVRRLAPHLARPVQMLFPLGSRSGYAKLSVGLWTYDRLAGVSDDERYHMLSRQEAVELEPRLRDENLYGAALYYEYVTDDARLVTEVVKSAAALGAVVANHAEVRGFVFEGERVVGARIHDTFSGEDFEVRARVVVNAAGPWVDGVRLMSEPQGVPKLRLTKGIHLGVLTERIGLSRIVVMNARDRRGVFAVPRGELTYLGTTDTDYPELHDYPFVGTEEAEYLLDAANRTFKIDPPLTLDDVVNAWAGLRPLLDQEGKKPAELSRKDEIMVNDAGLLSIAGGKLTTFRRMAERVVDLACEQLEKEKHPLPARLGESEKIPLSGGGTGEDVEAFAAALSADVPRIAGEVIERLVQVYGSNARQIAAAIIARPEDGVCYATSVALTPAEVTYTVRYEMALTLIDVLERRTRLLLWSRDCGLGVAEGVARTMARLLGWDEQRVESELAGYRSLVTRLTTLHDDSASAQVAHG